MGYSYDTLTGQLVCDGCGTHGGVRRVRCTYGYCQSPAFCATCRKSEAQKQFRAHCRENCKEASAEYKAVLALREETLERGEFVRTSAIGVEDGMVAVTFRDKHGNERAFMVTQENYRSVGLLDVATPETFGIFGAIPAPEGVGV